MKCLIGLFRLMRIHQWVKNAFVFTGLLFSQAWGDTALILKVVSAALSFGFVSSSVYILNDIVDREQDACHPKKKNRPLAAKTVSVSAAALLGVFLAVAGLFLAHTVSSGVVLTLLAYAVLNSAYSFRLKHEVILDVFIIAAGFMLRILAGTAGVGIPPSQWLMLCGIMVTLFLGFTKRRAESMALSDGARSHRQVLAQYSPVFLDKMISITATGTIMSYSLYTMSPDTIRIHHTPYLIYTVPFVMYGIFRFIYLLHVQKKGTDAAEDIVHDRGLLLALCAWLASTVWLIK